MDPRNTLANLGDTLGVARGSSGSTRETQAGGRLPSLGAGTSQSVRLNPTHEYPG